MERMPLNPYLHLVIYFYFRTNAASAGAAEARRRQGLATTSSEEARGTSDPAAPWVLALTSPAKAEHATGRIWAGHALIIT